MILTKQDDWSKRATSQRPPEVINNRRQILEIRMEKKMPTSATNELGKHPSKKVITELLENQQRKE